MNQNLVKLTQWIQKSKGALHIISPLKSWNIQIGAAKAILKNIENISIADISKPN